MSPSRIAAVALVAGLLATSGIALAAEDCRTGRDLTADFSPAQRKAVAAAAAGEANGEGKLYRLTRDDTPANILFGTLHVTDPRVLALPGAAEHAFQAATTMVIETADLLDERKMAALILSRPDLMNLPDGQTLSDLFSGSDATLVQAGLEASGMPAATVRTMQPWFLATGLLMPACEQRRIAEGSKLLDLDLADRAMAAGKTVLGLETGAEQLEALASMPMPDQADMLLSVLRNRDRMDDLFETMTALYLRGDIAAIVPAMEEIAPTSDDSERSAEIWQAFDERIVRQRNHLMRQRAEPILAEGGAFIAVGAQHLIGTEGLVELFRQDGWTVERLD
ncbi:TraB/GumN family protein [Aureimonas altamirensis]|uniref:TraB/GumN family protein n=1 Tax=Aureimonas altamirensis TaxID=370622 RepID=UPI002036A951|nr:TraB/GumN family protein [Aureimonas altamirensis]MCM2505715.1 TraB/GumN family protein [Aureimonas altamirensis]